MGCCACRDACTLCKSTHRAIGDAAAGAVQDAATERLVEKQRDHYAEHHHGGHAKHEAGHHHHERGHGHQDGSHVKHEAGHLHHQRAPDHHHERAHDHHERHTLATDEMVHAPSVEGQMVSMAPPETGRASREEGEL